MSEYANGGTVPETYIGVGESGSTCPIPRANVIFAGQKLTFDTEDSEILRQLVERHFRKLGGLASEQAIAATLGSERTCYVVGTICYDGWTTAKDSLYYHELSCGHEVETLGKEPPSYCPDCGAEVVKR